MSYDEKVEAEFPAQAAPKKYDRFTLYKNIYAKRKGKFDNKMLNKILSGEIVEHHRKNPDLAFVKVGEATKNADGSATYPLLFVMVPVQQQVVKESSS